MFETLLDVNVIDGAFYWSVLAIAALFLLYLLGREASVGWALKALVLLIVGAMLGVAMLWTTANVLDAFGGPPIDAAWFWVAAASAACLLAVWNLWRSRWWRKIIAVLALPVFALAATLGINAAYGLQPTIGSMLHLSTAPTIELPPLGDTDAAADAAPLWKTWEPPADLPAHGEWGEIAGGIPNTTSGFAARPAQIYLPPAALIADAPKLPLVIMMMGQPGDPDARFLAQAFDAFAAEHDGLAPIGLVIDQLGGPFVDPLCLDTERGQVETYVMQDVVPWAATSLGVLQNRVDWAVAGYSNGGGCAAYFGTKYPDVFGGLWGISPIEYAGVENPDETLDEIFDGDPVAYAAVWPTNIMAANAPYADSTAVFTVGEGDLPFRDDTKVLADAATEAGMATTFAVIDDAQHDVAALLGGFDVGLEVFGPRFGLVEPAPAADEEGTPDEEESS